MSRTKKNAHYEGGNGLPYRLKKNEVGSTMAAITAAIKRKGLQSKPGKRT